MIFLLALIPATMLTVAGYAVLYLAHRSEGGLKAFGRYLGIWAFTLAALLVLSSLILAGRGGRMHHPFMMRGCPVQESPGQGWPMPWGNAPPAAPSAPPGPAAPPPQPTP